MIRMQSRCRRFAADPQGPKLAGRSSRVPPTPPAFELGPCDATPLDFSARIPALSASCSRSRSAKKRRLALGSAQIANATLEDHPREMRSR